ncbi:unnamed protein product [Ceratitis capitata]|uniref:(Mediterranean fruit fly) hypothetical protein n=1 Tax=Ceratitis capitata TaxID=7213 RepID=A0A811V7X7_CERCA|nr:unnamed protein product [Ceratitis capitata]
MDARGKKEYRFNGNWGGVRVQKHSSVVLYGCSTWVLATLVELACSGRPLRSPHWQALKRLVTTAAFVSVIIITYTQWCTEIEVPKCSAPNVDVLTQVRESALYEARLNA